MEPIQEDICCPPFDPAQWDGKILTWTDKKFIKDSVFTLFYMPMNFGTVMRRTDKLIKAAGGSVPDYLMLSDHTSKWNMDIYIAVDKEIPGTQNTTMSGTFISKVYEGPYKETGNWHKDFGKWCTSQNYKPGKYYMWYTTCPKCAKKYGKNYVVIVAEIEKP
jgi:hypothetical protein